MSGSDDGLAEVSAGGWAGLAAKDNPPADYLVAADWYWLPLAFSPLPLKPSKGDAT